jgi:hypothetical protein|tara:strand:- start:76 stop:264 length:189 start_codon:yes stop_codon:yes gene_type:complete
MTNMELKVWTVGQLKEWLATAENDTDIVVANIHGDMVSDYNLGMVNVEEFMTMLTDPTLDGE